MSNNSPAFQPGTIQNRPKVAFSLFTMMLGDMMRHLHVDKAPKTIASPRPEMIAKNNNNSAENNNNNNTSSTTQGTNPNGSNNSNLPSMLPESNEAVFKSMGVDVGMRTVAHISNVAIVREPSSGTSDPTASIGGGGPQPQHLVNRIRPSTFLEAAKFVATHCWEYWFDHAPQQKFQHLEAFYIDEYESLSCFPFSSTVGGGGGGANGGTVNGIQYSTFVQGMIEGAMRACGWPVLVNFSQADDQGLQQYQILPLRLPAVPQAI